MDEPVTVDSVLRGLLSECVRKEVSNLTGELREADNKSYRLGLRVEEVKQQQQQQQQQLEKWRAGVDQKLAGVDQKLSKIFDMLCDLKKKGEKRDRTERDGGCDVDGENGEEQGDERGGERGAEKDVWSNLFGNITENAENNADSVPLSFEMSDEEPLSLEMSPELKKRK